MICMIFVSVSPVNKYILLIFILVPDFLCTVLIRIRLPVMDRKDELLKSIFSVHISDSLSPSCIYCIIVSEMVPLCLVTRARSLVCLVLTSIFANVPS